MKGQLCSVNVNYEAKCTEGKKGKRRTAVKMVAGLLMGILLSVLNSALLIETNKSNLFNLILISTGRNRVSWQGLELRVTGSQVQHPNHLATLPFGHF